MRKLLALAAVVVLAVLAGAAFTSSSKPATTYTVEANPVDSADEQRIVEYGDLNSSQREQFEVAMTSAITLDSKPVLVEYSGKTVRYEDQLYAVVIAVP